MYPTYSASVNHSASFFPTSHSQFFYVGALFQNGYNSLLQTTSHIKKVKEMLFLCNICANFWTFNFCIHPSSMPLILEGLGGGCEGAGVAGSSVLQLHNCAALWFYFFHLKCIVIKLKKLFTFSLWGNVCLKSEKENYFNPCWNKMMRCDQPSIHRVRLLLFWWSVQQQLQPLLIHPQPQPSDPLILSFHRPLKPLKKSIFR